MIPALLMGNVVILKVPAVGGLVHMLTIDAISKTLPPGTVNFISGKGRETMPPLMESGKVDSLAFIGGSEAADRLIKLHPEPHRLKLFLQLEAKNPAIFTSDMFRSKNAEILENAIQETAKGALSFNGQRCTALKILFVPRHHSERFAEMLGIYVMAMSIGLPWEQHTDGRYSQITPLPNRARVDLMRELIDDAVSKGAQVVNPMGGRIVGRHGDEEDESTLMFPAVVHPVVPGMRLWDEEQFGPIVPVVPYHTLDEVEAYAREGQHAQQASVFTSDAEAGSRLVDRFSSVFGKVNINSQCGRSPDSAPFSGRRSSALGVMSVAESLREFSVPTVVSYRDEGRNREILEAVQQRSKFMSSV